jgi:MoxR-like ATPase
MTDIYYQIKQAKDQIMDEISKVIVGQDEVISHILAAIFSNGHCLIIGVPGLAKTMIVKYLAQTLDLQFRRIQFTPDLMPSDITGTNIIYEDTPGRREFRFVHGPVFGNIILADEINRAPPKTQAALLEAMQEKQVTVGNTTYKLPTPFFVLATQNPIEQEGTYPLPEAQLDRFMFDVDILYPTFQQEEEIYLRTNAFQNVRLKPILNAKGILQIQDAINEVSVSNYVISYVARIVRATRPKEKDSPDFIKKTVEWGAGPRAGQHLILAAKSYAGMDARPYVTCEDVRRVAIPVLKHRISPNFQAQIEGLDTSAIIKKLIEKIPEPKVPKYEKKPMEKKEISP